MLKPAVFRTLAAIDARLLRYRVGEPRIERSARAFVDLGFDVVAIAVEIASATRIEVLRPAELDEAKGMLDRVDHFAA